MVMANTLAYCNTTTIADVKGFIAIISSAYK
jgi:hypothetical protein